MKTVLITGANKGIGLATTKKLVDNGYKVVAVSKSTTNLENINNNNLIIYKCNLLEKEQLKSLFKFLNKLSIDVLINNAGIGKFGDITKFNIDDWEKVIFLNLTVPFLMIKEISTQMKKNNYGKIINICSDASYLGFDEASAYCSSKHGLLGLSKALSIELKKYGIIITSICPGRVDTYFNNKTPGCRPNSLKDSDIANIIHDILKYDVRCNIETLLVSSSLE